MQGFRTINLPGLQTSPKEMIETLVNLVGQSCLNFITYEKNEDVERIVSSWPKSMNNERELALGFIKDSDFNSILNNYINTTK